MSTDTAATDANTIAKIGNIKATNLLSLAWTKLKTVITAHPIIAVATGIALVTTAVYKLYEATHISASEALDSMRKSRESYNETTSEIESLNSE